MGSFPGDARKTSLETQAWGNRFSGNIYCTAPRFLASELYPSRCGGRPALSSSSQKKGQKVCSTGSVPFSVCPHLASLPLFPAALQLAVRCHIQYPTSHLEPAWNPGVSKGPGLGKRREHMLLSQMLWLYYLGLGRTQMLFQTNQSISQSFPGFCWSLPVTNSFSVPSGVLCT